MSYFFFTNRIQYHHIAARIDGLGDDLEDSHSEMMSYSLGDTFIPASGPTPEKQIAESCLHVKGPSFWYGVTASALLKTSG